MNSKITKIIAEEIKDSKGTPTLKVTVWVDDKFGSFSVPSGASTGSHEAHELRDVDGEGVQKAIDNVNSIIAPALVGQNILNQQVIDNIMIKLDGTNNKDRLGGNAIIGISIACAKLGAKVFGMETYEYLKTLADIKSSRKVPYLFMNLIEGGRHTENGPAFQEYHAVPMTEDPRESIEMGKKIIESLREIILRDLGESSLILGDEGGFAPKTSDIRKPLLYLREAIEKCGLEKKVRIALDIAASTFYKDEFYKINGKNYTKKELMSVYRSLIKEFNVFSIEDPFYEEDFKGFNELRNKNSRFFVMKDGLYIVGDDLTVSNEALLRKAIEQKSINAMIIKPNQIGTLTETLDTMKLARKHGIELIVSHRGEETDDDFIADLAYAFGCFGLKAGAPTKTERMVKYKRLLDITR